MSNVNSHNARAVAREVKQRVIDGKKVNLFEIQQKHGYSKKSALAYKAVKTLSYQEEIKPVIAQYDRMLAKIRTSMENKDTDAETLLNLSVVAKNTLHDRQLLAGKSTENIATTPQIIVYSDADPLSEQLKKAQAGASTEQA